MENGINQEYNGKEVAINDLEVELEAQKKESLKNSRFRQIDPGKTANLSFTGRTFKRTATGTDEKGVPYKADKVDFELVETVTEGPWAGKHKFFSVGAKNKIVREIMQNFKADRLTMLISRTGEGKSTKYGVTTPE